MLHMKHNHILLIGISLLLSSLLIFPTIAQDDDNEIVFVTGKYTYNIAIASSNGVVPVTNDKYVYSHLSTPQWSSDGNRIAFTDDKNIYLVNADGSNLIQLTDYTNITGQMISNISWSPDGLTMAVTLSHPDQGDYGGSWIRLIDLKTLDIRNLTSDDYLDGQFGISWSPDSQSIVFTSNRDSEIPDASGLYLVDVKNGKVSALTDLVSRRRDDRYPSWSPDGKQIAFVSANDDNGRWDIYLFDVLKSAFERLTNPINAPKISGLVYGGTMDWSPDSKKLVFSACPNLALEECNLFTFLKDGTGLVQITRDEENGDFDPSWRPNSSN